MADVRLDARRGKAWAGVHLSVRREQLYIEVTGVDRRAPRY